MDSADIDDSPDSRDIALTLKDLDANKAQLEAAEFAAKSGVFTPTSQTREGAVDLMQQLAGNLIPKVNLWSGKPII